MTQFIISLVISVALGVGGYLYFKQKSKSSSTTVPVPTANFTIEYPPDQAGKDGTSFDFPSQGSSINYVVKAAKLGDNVSIQFSLTGAGTVVPVQSTPDDPSAYLTLYFQRQGDDTSGAGPFQQYRYFSTAHLKLGAQADYELTVDMKPGHWGDVYGKLGSDYPNEFAAAVANVGVVGFVFGSPGAGATGHGVYASGPVHFTLKSFS